MPGCPPSRCWPRRRAWPIAGAAPPLWERVQMPKLHELQTGIRLSVLGDSRPEILAAILDDGIDPARRLQIHRNNFRLSLTEALKANFPVVCRVVDERFFAYAADRFITAHPPTSPCLSEYGAALPEFLEQFEPAQSVPYVPDLARLEWAILESSRAEDRLPVDVAALHQVDIPQCPTLVLELDPSIRLLRSVWPIATIWAVHQSEDEIRPIDLHSGGCRVRIRRSGEGVRVDEIAADQFAF